MLVVFALNPHADSELYQAKLLGVFPGIPMDAVFPGNLCTVCYTMPIPTVRCYRPITVVHEANHDHTECRHVDMYSLCHISVMKYINIAHPTFHQWYF